MIKVPQTETRPLTDRIRISVFDILKEHLEGARVLDLFAGSGVTGIEALSRGAASAVFVDASADAVSIVKTNLDTIRADSESTAVESTIESFIENYRGKLFDIIFLDPPFEDSESLDLSGVHHLLNNKGLLVVRLPSRLVGEPLFEPGVFREAYRKKYGKSQVIFYVKEI